MKPKLTQRPSTLEGSVTLERTVALDEAPGQSSGETAATEGLENRLRAWRKAESERLGQPQFFILGTTALRSIVMAHPRTLDQLRDIEGVGSEKLDRFGTSILQVLNA